MGFNLHVYACSWQQPVSLASGHSSYMTAVSPSTITREGVSDTVQAWGERSKKLIPSSVFYLLPKKGFDPERYSGSEIPVLTLWKRCLGGNFKKEPFPPDSLPIRDSKNKIIPLVVVGGSELGDILVFEDPFGI